MPMRDSTLRLVHVVGQALSVEMLPDSVHYNQITSKEMKAHFLNGQIRMAGVYRQCADHLLSCG